MMNRKEFVVASLSALLSGMLAACGSTSSANEASNSSSSSSSAAEVAATPEGEATSNGILRVGALAGLHADILRNYAVPQLAKLEIEFEVVEYPDATQANDALAAGEIDADYCQHGDTLAAYNKDHSADLRVATSVHYDPVAVFSKKHDDLRAVPDGATVALASDQPNMGRALLLLQQEGLIRMEDPYKLESTTEEVVENPRNLEFREFEAADVAGALADVDYAIINNNLALSAGLRVADAIAVEPNDSKGAERYCQVVCTTAPMLEDARTVALVQAFKSDKFAHFLHDAYNQDVLPAS